MLWRKMLRELKTNFGQFFSIFLLSALALSLFVTFEGHVLSQNVARDTYHDACHLSDLWVCGEGFSEENLEKIRSLDFVEEAQLRMSVVGTAPSCGGAQVDIYLERENLVNVPFLIEGEEFDPLDPAGIWLADAFASRRGISIGDDFTIEYNGITFTREVKGLVESAEYEFRQAQSDADMFLENIAIVFMSYDAFPVREYVNHMIRQGKITAKAVVEETSLLDSMISRLEEAGMTADDITQEMLLEVVEKTDDDKLARMMPFTQLVIRTKDGGALAHEDAVAQALEKDYAAIVDRASVPGLARLDSELEQHQMFSWLFVVIFVGIAVLVIATSMSRMVEKQRTQIGTLNALGMKKYKVAFHYVSFSLLVSFTGVVLGTVVGIMWLCPVMTDLFAQWYIVPGLHPAFHPVYLAVAVAIVLVCVLSSYLSCRRLLKVKPSESLRPAAPKAGKRCIFERLPFWGRLSFDVQYNLRDISRAKLRAFMGIMGTAVGMLLMVYGVGCREMVGQMKEIAFDKTAPAEYQVNLSSDAKLFDVEELAERLEGELVMVDAVEVSAVRDASSSAKEKGTVTVTEGKGLYNILDLDNQVVSLKPGTVGISRKFAEKLGLSVGDTLYWHIYSENEWHEATVGMIYRSSESQGIAFLREDFEQTGADYVPSLLMTDHEAKECVSMDFVTAVNSRREMEEAFLESMEVINIMIVMMAAFSAIMIVVVLYNSGALSFNERVMELATLKVMGLGSAKIRQLLTLENLWLSIIGIFLGAPLGNLSLNAMMNSNGENFDYYFKLPSLDYLISGILVLNISMLVGFLFSKRIRRLDMVGTLKGTE